MSGNRGAPTVHGMDVASRPDAYAPNETTTLLNKDFLPVDDASLTVQASLEADSSYYTDTDPLKLPARATGQNDTLRITVHTRVRRPAYFCFFCIGLAPWLLVNAIWAEVPIFVHHSSAGNGIASRLAISIQIANLAPLAFLGYLWLRDRQRRAASRHGLLPGGLARRKLAMSPPHSKVVGLTFLAAIILSVLLAALGHETSAINGRALGWELLVLSGCCGAVGCLSTVIIWPFVSVYHPNLLTAMSTGMGISGVIPAVISIAQDPGLHPRFGVSPFFFVSTVILVLAGMCYMWIVTTDVAIDYRVDLHTHSTAERELILPGTPLSKLRANSVLADTRYSVSDTGSAFRIPVRLESLFIQAGISGVNFFVQSIGPYMLDGFGSRGYDKDRLLLWFGVAGAVSATIGRIACLYLGAWQPKAAAERCVFDWGPRQPWVAAVLQLLCAGLLLVFSFPLYVSAHGTIACYALLCFIFTLNNTMLYKTAAVEAASALRGAGNRDSTVTASSAMGGTTPSIKHVDGNLSVDARPSAQATRWLAFAEQFGSFFGTLIALFLSLFAF